jgi:hypothetical protein
MTSPPEILFPSIASVDQLAALDRADAKAG